MILAVISVLLALLGMFFAKASHDAATESTLRISAAEEIATLEPDRAKPAWDVARITLQAYFNRNLQQVDAIFWMSVVVMLIGFLITLVGVSKATFDQKNPLGAELATGAGVLTEFIAGTFILIYRSAISQAVKYIPTLERINSVGMAMQILDTMNDPSEKDLNSKTKAELVKLLIAQVSSTKETSEGLSSP